MLMELAAPNTNHHHNLLAHKHSRQFTQLTAISSRNRLRHLPTNVRNLGQLMHPLTHLTPIHPIQNTPLLLPLSNLMIILYNM